MVVAMGWAQEQGMTLAAGHNQTMLRDFHLPAGSPQPATSSAPLAATSYLSARWTPASLAAVAAALVNGGKTLRELPDESLIEAWSAAVEAFLDPGSQERQQLAEPLRVLCGLSPEGLAAGLEAVLGGVRRHPAAALLRRAATLRRAGEGAVTAGASAPGEPERADVPDGAALLEQSEAVNAAADETLPVLVVLASNLPALAVQPLLPALALRRPVVLKSPSAEPLFAPAFLAALVRREPRLAGAVAAATWAGGNAALEAPLLTTAGKVVAYGGADALADLSRRAPGKVVAYGPMTSLAAVQLGESGCAPAEAVAAGLARDVALFDQRGCLSVVAVYVAGGLDEAEGLAGHLETALADLAARWPPGPPPAAALAAVQQARLEAELRGLRRTALPLAAGTVLVEPEPLLRPSPGLRTVRVHPLPDLEDLPDILAPWRGRLQGAALSGPAAWSLAPRLAELGISRCAAPGDLQSPDATWHNGGIDPLQALTRGSSTPLGHAVDEGQR